MSEVAVSSPSEGKPSSENVFLTQSSADMLMKKIDAVLHIVGGLGAYVLERAYDAEGEEWRKGGALDGGVRKAAEVTLIKACDRLDFLLGNDENWKVDISDRILIERTTALTNSNLRINELRTLAVKQNARPSVVRGAILLRKGPFFYAVIGGTLHENAVYGVGKSPEEAYTNLDNILLSVDAGEKTIGGSEDVQQS